MSFQTGTASCSSTLATWIFLTIRVHLTSRAIQLWPQPCRPHVRPYIGVSLAEPLFEEVEFWLHGRHSSHLSPLMSARVSIRSRQKPAHSVVLDHLSSIVARY